MWIYLATILYEPNNNYINEIKQSFYRITWFHFLLSRSFWLVILESPFPWFGEPLTAINFSCFTNLKRSQLFSCSPCFLIHVSTIHLKSNTIELHLCHTGRSMGTSHFRLYLFIYAIISISPTRGKQSMKIIIGDCGITFSRPGLG